MHYARRDTAAFPIVLVIASCCACGAPHQEGPRTDAGNGQLTDDSGSQTPDSTIVQPVASPFRDPPRRQLLLALLDGLEKGVELVVQATNDNEYGVVHWALGRDGTSMLLSVAKPCSATSSVEYAETCLSDFGSDATLGAELDGCFANACTDATNWFVDTYVVARPSRRLNQRSTIAYPLNVAALPSGTVTYSPSPATHWEFQNIAGTIHSSCAIEANLTVLLMNGETVDLSYTGTAQGTKGSTFGYELALKFSGVLPSAQEVTFSLSNGDAQPRDGALKVGSEIVAKFDDDGVVWL